MTFNKKYAARLLYGIAAALALSFLAITYLLIWGVGGDSLAWTGLMNLLCGMGIGGLVAWVEGE